jgi:hypothetical protein
MFIDNWYSSPPLFHTLLKEGIQALETVKGKQTNKQKTSNKTKQPGTSRQGKRDATAGVLSTFRLSLGETA